MKTNLAENPRLGDDESLFSRDIDGRLVRLDKVTAESLDQDATLAIDDRVIRVKRALPAVDSQGNLRFDQDGKVVPRATTIFDAAAALGEAVPILDDHGNPLKDDKDRIIHRPRTDSDPTAMTGPVVNPIPVLCHLPHQDPVAVCRACVVEISRIKRGERRTERKLLPACQHRVEDQMEVRTIATSKRVESAVKTVVELLMADHPSPCEKERRYREATGKTNGEAAALPDAIAKSARHGGCELEALAGRLNLGQPRFKSRPPREKDNSSLLIAVDHSACIMCDRCVRGCNEIKNNQVIGRMRKGYKAQIAFDLNAPMGSSTCVSCGECMISCPTGALVFRDVVRSTIHRPDEKVEAVDVDDLLARAHPDIRRAFAEVSPTFLDWNSGAIVRRHFTKGQLICRQGEYGSTAFFIEKGTANVFISRSDRPDEAPGGGLFGFLRKKPPRTDEAGSGLPKRRFIPVDSNLVLSADKPQATLGEGELLGEMACLNGYPRAATVRAGDDGCTVLEMQRNVLDIMRRSRSYREEMDRRVRKRVIGVVLANIPIFAGLDESFIDELSHAAGYRRCGPGEVIIRQGQRATGGEDESDGLFLIRSGFVKIEREQVEGQSPLTYRGPGNYIGEIGLLSSLAVEDLGAEGPQFADKIAEIGELAGPAGFRIATCSALDHVELVRISPEDFRRILKRASPEVKRTILTEAIERLRQTRAAAEAAAGQGRQGGGEFDPVRAARLREALDQGLIGAQSLLVLDLQKCTRCDECTKACSDTHGGVTRLIREGLRFDKYLVASSCRSCHDPLCLIGCPVDAIHRRPGSNEIWIENTCIGCGKCSENCPYGNINMHELPHDTRKDHDGPTAIARRATTCDQCRSLPGHSPNCVVACPHDAAHRMQGQELFALVAQSTNF